MTKQTFYRYLGTNGTILTSIHIEGAYGVKLIKLVADSNKILKNINDNVTRNSVLVPEEEVKDWVEVSKHI